MVLHVSRITSTSIPPENPLYRGMLRRSRCVLIFSLKYPSMTINDIIHSILVVYILLFTQAPIHVYVSMVLLSTVVL